MDGGKVILQSWRSSVKYKCHDSYNGTGKKDTEWKGIEEIWMYSENKPISRRRLRFIYLQSSHLAC